MKTEWTKGPWRVVGEVHDVQDANGAKWPLYCANIYAEQSDGYSKNLLYLQSSDHLGASSSTVSREEAKANARLIAAAPEMFALLERMTNAAERRLRELRALNSIDALQLTNDIADARALLAKVNNA